jgi:hypothetical protein
MAEQVGNFTNLARLWASSNNRTAHLLSKSLFFISAGSNDLFVYSDIGPQNNDTELLQGLVSSYAAYLRVSPKHAIILSFTILTCQVL